MPGGGFSTVRIDLPADWDSLMAGLGYPTLSDMYLQASEGYDPSAVQSVRTQRTPTRTNYYNIRGQRTNKPRRGLYILRTSYDDGSSQGEKRISK